MKKITALRLAGAMVLTLAGCDGKGTNSAGADARTITTQTTTALDGADAEKTRDIEATGATAITDPTEETTILTAVATSLKYSYEDELIPIFEATNLDIKTEGISGNSGKPQTQTGEGLEADVFMSAAMKQIDALKEESIVDADSIVELLEDKIVLVTSAGSSSDIKSFEDIIRDETITIGGSEGVPVSQYTKEALTTLGLWDQVEVKVSLGTSVTEVLNWVVEGSTDAGIVYAADTATNEHMKVVAETPEGSLSKKVIYPVGVVTASEKKDAAQKFVELLQSGGAVIIFKKYGFTASQTAMRTGYKKAGE